MPSASVPSSSTHILVTDFRLAFFPSNSSHFTTNLQLSCPSINHCFPSTSSSTPLAFTILSLPSQTPCLSLYIPPVAIWDPPNNPFPFGIEPKVPSSWLSDFQGPIQSDLAFGLGFRLPSSNFQSKNWYLAQCYCMIYLLAIRECFFRWMISSVNSLAFKLFYN